LLRLYNLEERVLLDWDNHRRSMCVYVCVYVCVCVCVCVLCVFFVFVCLCVCVFVFVFVCVCVCYMFCLCFVYVLFYIFIPFFFVSKNLPFECLNLKYDNNLPIEVLKNNFLFLTFPKFSKSGNLKKKNNYL